MRRLFGTWVCSEMLPLASPTCPGPKPAFPAARALAMPSRPFVTLRRQASPDALEWLRSSCGPIVAATAPCALPQGHHSMSFLAPQKLTTGVTPARKADLTCSQPLAPPAM